MLKKVLAVNSLLCKFELISNPMKCPFINRVVIGCFCGTQLIDDHQNEDIKGKEGTAHKKDENKCATVCAVVRKMFWKFLAPKFWGLLSHVWGCSAHVTWEKSFNLIPFHLIFFSFLNSILETPEVKKHMYAGTTHACQNTRWLDYEIEKLSTHSTLSRATCWALLYAYLQIFHLCSTVCTTWRLRRFFDILDFPLRCTSLRSQLSDTWMYLVW